MRIAVGNNQFGTRGAVHDATPLEPHVVQHQTFLRVKCCRELPIEPVNAIAVDGEGDAVGLGNLDRLEVGARRHGASLVLAISGRNRLDVVLLDLQHTHLVEVDDAEQTLDRAGVAVVVGGTSQVRDSARNAVVGLERMPHRASGEHVDLNQAHVGNPATRERLDHQRILLDGVLDGDIFVIGNGRLRAGEMKILSNRASVEIDSNFA